MGIEQRHHLPAAQALVTARGLVEAVGEAEAVLAQSGVARR
jgi:hypothetical protein